MNMLGIILFFLPMGASMLFALHCKIMWWVFKKDWRGDSYSEAYLAKLDKIENW